MNELEIIEHRQIKGFSVFVNTVDYRTAHFHPEWELIWVLDQPLAVTCGQTKFVVRSGEVVIFNPNEPHEFHKIKECATFLCLQISVNILPVSEQCVLEARLPHEYMTEDAFQKLRQRLVAVAEAYLKRTENYALYCMGESCLMMYQLFSLLPHHRMTAEERAAIERRNARLNRVIQYVDSHYTDKIRLADLAEQEDCSMTHLSHFIRNTMNQTFQEYVNTVRFNRACELMAEGKRKMIDICMEAGFSDYRYFAKAFRQRFDLTPEEYSRFAAKNQLESAVVHRSIHSMEQFYSTEESLALLEKYSSM